MRRVRSKGEERVLGVPRVRVLELGAGEPGMVVRMRTGRMWLGSACMEQAPREQG